ncbi:hypothetical protein [Paenibacillus humicus]|uniref:hypothetical protein n=1 Tax=Paenibacillus humicus TaxID=412861 RepID=UPI003D2DE012
MHAAADALQLCGYRIAGWMPPLREKRADRKKASNSCGKLIDASAGRRRPAFLKQSSVDAAGGCLCKRPQIGGGAVVKEEE